MSWGWWLFLALISAVAAGTFAERWTYEPGYSWGKQVLVALDQLANALFCRGWADETFSARCWRLQGRYRFWRVMRRVVDFIFRPLEREHCRLSYESELFSLQQAPETRKKGGDNG